jgi:hypothetical protein
MLRGLLLTVRLCLLGLLTLGLLLFDRPCHGGFAIGVGIRFSAVVISIPFWPIEIRLSLVISLLPIRRIDAACRND